MTLMRSPYLLVLASATSAAALFVGPTSPPMLHRVVTSNAISQPLKFRCRGHRQRNNVDGRAAGSSDESALSMAGGSAEDDDAKFSLAQRIESIKCVVAGALAGGIALAPFTALHDIFVDSDGLVRNSVAQWEFDTDMGSLQAALFAIVYRYCVREDTNPMLNQGVVGAFVLVRTLSRVSVPGYCTAAPLDCGEPLGYFDWDMLTQVGLNGLESAAMFGATAAAMEYCFSRGIISKFR